MKHYLLAALLGALSLSSVVQAKDNSEVATQITPGKGVIGRTRTVAATVTEIDAAKRHVTLKSPKGELFPLTIGPDARNLDQVKVGDRVVVHYEEALSLTLKKDGKALVSGEQSVEGVRAPAGDRPGGAIAEQIEVTADVTAVNRKTQVVTLRGPQRTVDVRVRDPKQLKLIKVGDQIEAVYVQAVALSVAPAARK